MLTVNDFEQMSDAEIKALIANGQRALASKEVQKKNDAIAKIREIIAHADLDVADVVEALTAAKPAVRSRQALGEAKYRNPHNAAETWTGRGRKPKWFSDLIAGGADVTELLIPGASQGELLASN